MFTIMQTSKAFQYNVGFRSHELNRKCFLILKICFYTAIMIITFISGSVALVTHFNEFGYISETTYAVGVHVMMSISYFSTLYQRHRIHKLIAELQDIVNQRKFSLS